MKKSFCKILSVCLVLVMALSLCCTTAFAEENDISVVVSLEGLTIGQGLYVKPTAYNLSEINNLVAQKGYGPYTTKNLTAAMAILAMMLDNGISTDGISGWDRGLYIENIKGLDTGKVNIPESISNASGITNDNNYGNDDEYLGAFDYSNYSGWMFFVNNEMGPVGLSDYVFSNYKSYADNTYVLRLEYSIYGWGVDIGGDSWGMFNEVGTFANMDSLYIAYANSDNSKARESVTSVMEKYLVSQEEVDNATDYIVNYNPADHCSHMCHSDNGFVKLIWKIINFFSKLFSKNSVCACGVAH